MTIAKQKADLQKIQDTIAAGAAKIEAVDPDLRPEARQARIATIRQDTLARLESVAADMHKRQQEAKQGLDFWSQAAVRRRAKFADDPALDAAQRSATFETLKRARTGELLDYLKDAIGEKSIARAEAVRLEFYSRPDSAKLGQEFGTLFAQVVDPQARQMEAELGEIAGVADYAQVLVREFARGASNPVERLAAARSAGFVQPAPEPMDPTERAAGLAA